MRAGPLNRSQGAGSRIGCVLDIDFRKVDAAHGQSFMERSVYGHGCTVANPSWNLTGLLFNGTSSVVNPPASSIFDFLSSDRFAVEAIFEGNDLINPVYQMLFDKWKAADLKGYSVGFLNNERKLRAEITAGTYPANDVQIKMDETIADHRRVHVAVYYDASLAASGLTIRLDGDSKALTTINDNDISGDITNDQNSEIGNRGAGGYWFNGLMAVVKVYRSDQYAAKMLQRAVRSRTN